MFNFPFLEWLPLVGGYFQTKSKQHTSTKLAELWLFFWLDPWALYISIDQITQAKKWVLAWNNRPKVALGWMKKATKMVSGPLNWVPPHTHLKMDSLTTAELWTIMESAFIRQRNITFDRYVLLTKKNRQEESLSSTSLESWKNFLKIVNWGAKKILLSEIYFLRIC